MAKKILVEWKKGGDHPPSPDGDFFVAGIHVGDHGNAVECYGETAKEAAEIRDHIMDCLSRCAQADAAKLMMKNLASVCGNDHPDLDN